MGDERENIGRGWAWLFEDGLCHWAKPSQSALEREKEPSPEARAVHVAIVPMKLWRRARKALDRQEAEPSPPPTEDTPDAQ